MQHIFIQKEISLHILKPPRNVKQTTANRQDHENCLKIIFLIHSKILI